jgi:hypothetical protein
VILVDLKSFVFSKAFADLEVLILVGLKSFGMKEIRDFAEVLILLGLRGMERATVPSAAHGRSGLASLPGGSVSA